MQIKELQGELDNLDALMFQIYQTQSAITNFTDASTLNGYNADWSISKKAEYIIRKNSRPMTTAEIADSIVNDYENSIDRKFVVRNLSVVFATQKTKFKKTKNAKGDNVYIV